MAERSTPVAITGVRLSGMLTSVSRCLSVRHCFVKHMSTVNARWVRTLSSSLISPSVRRLRRNFSYSWNI